MRHQLNAMLETWSEAGWQIRLSLTTGEVITGRLQELDSTEIMLEPVRDGAVGPLTIVFLDHVVTATYVEV